MSRYTERESSIYHLFLEVEGEREHQSQDVLVLIHGLGLDQTTWSFIIPYLLEKYHLLLIDLRGHGKSYRGECELSWSVLMEDIFQLLRHFKGYDLHLVGHALGGHLAIRFATLFPEMIRSLTLLSTLSIFSEAWAETIINGRKDLTRDNISFLANQMIPKLVYPLTDEKQQLLQRAYSRVELASYFDYLELIRQMNWETVLKQIQCPVLQLAGERDFIYPPQVIGLAISYMKNARFLIVPDSANLLQLDQPKLLAEWIHSFINEKVEQMNKEDEDNQDSLFTCFHREVNKSISNMVKLMPIGVDPLGATEASLVQLVDKFRVRINGTEILEGWNQRNAKRLFTYLIIHKSTTREELCDLFWPDVEIDKARSSLRVSLNHLKKLIPKDYLIVDNEHVQIKGDIECDYFHLKDLLQRIGQEQDRNEKLRLIEEVLKCFPPPLFPGLYDNWILLIRERIELELTEWCLWASKQYSKQGNKMKAKQFKDYVKRVENK